MRYLKLIISLILALVIIVAVIWFGLIILLFSVLIAPFVMWFAKRKLRTNDAQGEAPQSKEKPASAKPYKVIDAEYEIIDKSKKI